MTLEHDPQSVKCLTHSQQLPHVSCGAGASIKGCFVPVLVVKGRLHKALGPISARQLCYMCMPMRPNKAQTAVHGCHYLGQEPIGLLPGWYGWVGVWACRLLYCSKRVTFLVDCVKCVSIPIIKTGWPTPSLLRPTSPPPPLFFLTSPLTSIECRLNLYTEVDVEYQVD